jgi:hypothetical protein
MDDSNEFAYRLPRRVGGQRAGAHRGKAPGSGLEFLGHLSLFQHPDPRRLDLRASLLDLNGDWLVRVNRQRAAVTVRVLVDVSASMQFGARPKLEVVADFVEALGHSAFRMGDPLGMLAFDAAARDDLDIAPRHGRGTGEALATMLRACDASRAGSSAGLRAAVERVAGRSGLVFLVSDFHGVLAELADALDLLAPAHVVPIVVWDPAEIEAPRRDGIAVLEDAETHRSRTFWVRPALRERWREAVAARREALRRLFADRDLRPFHLGGAFDAQAMTGYFLEVAP